MSHIQFIIARQTQKVDGALYKAGDVFDFDPDSLVHQDLWKTGVIKPVKVEPAPQRDPAPEPPPKPAPSRSRSRSKK